MDTNIAIQLQRQAPAALPRLGLGVYTLRPDEVHASITAAAGLGYRLFDTAASYKNERAVGEALAASGLQRSEYYVTTKLSPKDMRSHDSVHQALLKSLGELQMTYVDCFMMHWPGAARIAPDDPRNATRRRDTWQAMVDLRRRGLVRHLGVSNFQVRHFQSLTEGEGAAGTAPAPLPDVHQLELHPLCQQREVVQFCNDHGITVQQYSPLMCGDQRLLRHPVLEDGVARWQAAASVSVDAQGMMRGAAAAAGESGFTWEDECAAISTAGISLMWGWAQGYSSVVRSTSAEHLLSNVEALRLWNSINALPLRRENSNGVPQGSDVVDCKRNAHRRRIVEELTLAMQSETDLHACWNSNVVH